MTELCELGLKYRCDKTPAILHSYTPAYYEMFKNKRDIKKVLEVGIGNPQVMSFIRDYIVGCSLFMWRDFFPQATIYGADHRVDCLINDQERIRSFYVDQSNCKSLLKLRDQIGGDFDLIIDDGSHIIEHQILTAIILNQCLSDDGLYVIEDVTDMDTILPGLIDLNPEKSAGKLTGRDEIDYLIWIRKRK